MKIMSKIIIALLIAFFTMTSVNAQENEVITPTDAEIQLAEDVEHQLSQLILAWDLAPPALPKISIEYGKFSQDQIRLLRMAYDIGNEYGHPETTQAILLQETNAGAGGRESGFQFPALGRCYGIMQMKVAAVVDVLQTYPNLIGKYFSVSDPAKIPPREIIAKLKNDDEFSLRMGVNYYKKYYNGSLVKAIMTYNQGPAGMLQFKQPDRHPYMIGIQKNLSVAKKFNDFIKGMLY